MEVLGNRMLLRVVIVVQKVFSKFAYVLGPICVVLAISLISFVTFVYFTSILPFYMFEGPKFIISLMHIAWAIWAAFNVLFNYILCISTSPGYTKDYFKVESAPRKRKEFTNILEVLDLEDDGEKYCYKCNHPKPDRCHHCSICNRCVLRMDHHCPWMANCVGHYNYKYFVLFLFYITIAAIYVCLLCALPPEYGGTPRNVIVPYFGRAGFHFVMLLSGAISVSTGIMGAWHLYLIITQQTTIEFYQNAAKSRDFTGERNEPWVNVYNVSVKSNFESIFGKSSWPWKWILPSLRPPMGDGITFAVIYPDYNV